MSQQRYLQQLRSSVQNNKESAINAVKTQLHKANDGSFILGRYFDSTNGVRTIIGVNAYTTNGKTMSIYEFDSIEHEELLKRIGIIESTVGIGEGSDGSTVSITDRVSETERLIEILNGGTGTTNSIAYKIYQSEDKLIGDKFSDTYESDTIEGAKKYSDKAIDDALLDGGRIDNAIDKAAAAATTKVVVGSDPNSVMTIEAKTNTDNSTTYEISLADIAVQSELVEVKEYIGMVDGGSTGETVTIIDRIETVNERITTEVETLNNTIQKNTDAITVLNGTGEGSVQKTVSDAITSLVNGADEKYDTLKEISDYIANDTTNAAQMTSDISELKKNVNALSKTDIVACSGSDLIKVTTSTTTNSESKEEKTYTICANNIASVSDVNTVKTELQNSITSVDTKLAQEVANRTTAVNNLKSYVDGENTLIRSEISTLDTKVNVLTGNSETSVAGQIDTAVKNLTGDATLSGNNLGLLEDRIEELEYNVNTEGGHVDTLIKTTVEALDYTDTPYSNQYVSSVNQIDGKIEVKRTLFANAVVTTDGKSFTQVLTQIEENIASSEESAKAAATKVTVSGNEMLSISETKSDVDGSVTYDINLSDTWDCGTFVYEEPETNEEDQ